MRILVTGSGGFIGGHVARTLASAGHQVFGTYRNTLPSPDFESIQLDLLNSTYLPWPFDIVIHCAAAAGPWHEPKAIACDNLTATEVLIRAAYRHRAKAFIFMSSISIYGKVESLALDEETALNSKEPYGRSKRHSEGLLHLYSTRLPALALRLPGVIGPGESGRNWLSQIAKKLLANEPIEAFNLNTSFNNAVHVLDLANFSAGLLKRKLQGFDALVLGANGTLTVREVIERLAKGLDRKANIIEVPARNSSFVLDSGRAITKYAYEPAHIKLILDRYAGELKQCS